MAKKHCVQGEAQLKTVSRFAKGQEHCVQREALLKAVPGVVQDQEHCVQGVSLLKSCTWGCSGPGALCTEEITVKKLYLGLFRTRSIVYRGYPC